PPTQRSVSWEAPCAKIKLRRALPSCPIDGITDVCPGLTRARNSHFAHEGPTVAERSKLLQPGYSGKRLGWVQWFKMHTGHVVTLSVLVGVVAGLGAVVFSVMLDQ